MYSYLAITPHIDLALISLYVFWAFFAGLIYYLHRESKREGYPLVEDRGSRAISIVGFPGIPDPKTYILHGDHTSTLPSGRQDRSDLAIAPTASFSGAPYAPTGDPMGAGVGPGAWAERQDVPDLTVDGAPKIVPLRAAPTFWIAAEDPDPRGFAVVGGDKRVAGVVSDIWVDLSEYMMRYFEVELPSGRKVLLPTTFAKVDGKRGRVICEALYSDNFAGVPVTKSPDQVTLLEEDMIVGYYGGGLLYAHPGRAEPLL
ncbi:photosynthetic reaction center subunit H [Methylopila turkensis]|uniref:Reaction center protein H chain n=1 Tax=Methylopila turkensis TaxID=1437816 RepID=A0A9W6JLB5_9HYPH|nr:photosynthetic reaction center subunit H [Methylopila turkensis]GLK78288.1 reaction center protein H chain [Methylopila turkensis]